MIKSMTGYGTVTVENEKFALTIEIKSLNSKFLDLSSRLPKFFSDKDADLRNLVSKYLERGKVSLSLDIEYKGEQKPKVSINKEVVKGYYQELLSLAQELEVESQDIFRMALQMPDTYMTSGGNEAVEEDWLIVAKAIEDSLIQCEQFRLHEGEVLQTKLLEYILKIRTNLQKIVLINPTRIQAVRDRLHKQLNDLLKSEQYDNNRFEQEVIYYIEKLDIQEEIVRLEKHLDYFDECIKGKDANGKKLGFVAQEIGREINTIGSKANDADMQRLVVEMKEELEKIKEQSLNVL